jgi:hypothetical protein
MTLTPSGIVGAAGRGMCTVSRTAGGDGRVAFGCLDDGRVLVAAVDVERSGIMMISGISSRTVGDVGTNRFTKLGILVTIVVVLAGSAAQLINYGFFDQRIRALDSSSDGGVFGAIGDIALAAAAVSAWVLAARVRSARSVAVALAGLMTFLAADKVARLHDHISHWLAFYLPVLVASFICLVVVARGLSGRPQFRVDRDAGRPVVDGLIGLGLLLLVFSFLLHLFGERLLLALGANSTGLAYQIKAATKHGTEVAGWLLIALGLLRLGLPRRCHPEVV